MAPKTADPDLEQIEDVDVDDDSLEAWGLDGIGEEDDDDKLDIEETEDGDSPEEDESEGPADDESAQADEDDDLPGDESDELDETTPDPTAGPSAEADRQAEDDEASDVPEVKPWKPKADGKEIEVPRSQVFTDPNTGEEWILFPAKEGQRTLQHHLADRGAWREEKKGLLQQLADLNPEHNEQVIKAREMTEFFWSLVEKSDDEVLELVDKMRSGKGEWEARMKAKSLEERLNARESVTVDPDPELQQIQQEELTTKVRGSLRQNLNELLSAPELSGLIELDEAEEDLWELRNNFIFEAEKDYPDQGIRKGEIVFDMDYVAKHLERQAERIKRVRENARRAKEVERENARKLEGAKTKTPAPKTPPKKPRRKSGPEEENFDVDAFLNDTEL